VTFGFYVLPNPAIISCMECKIIDFAGNDRVVAFQNVHQMSVTHGNGKAYAPLCLRWPQNPYRWIGGTVYCFSGGKVRHGFSLTNLEIVLYIMEMPREMSRQNRWQSSCFS
jgi:hypothetical protein